MNRHTIPILYRYCISAVLMVAFIIIGGNILSSGIINRAQSAVILQVGIYIILTVSLNIPTGYLGQLPLGHAGFMAVGAYSGALFFKSGILSGAPSVIGGLIVAGLVAALFGIIIGIPALRLRGDYLAIITLGFGEIIRVAIINLASVTGGTPGLKNIPKHSNFTLVYICVFITCTVIHLIMKSRHGRAILSIRDNEIASESCGVNTTYYKVMAFTLSAFFAGVAGALYAGNQGLLVPNVFAFMTSINILVMVVLGGMGSMTGSVIAASVLTALPLAMQGFNEYRMIIYSLLLIVVMIYRPTGLMGNFDFSFDWIINKVSGRVVKEKPKQEGGKPNDKA